MSAKHVLIAANPKSGATSSQHAVTELNDSLNGQGLESRIVTSLEQLQADAMALHHTGDLRTVVSAGGDGTVAALANLLPAEIPLHIFPLGTENLLAKYLGLTTDIAFATDIIANGTATALDVGLANGKLFLVMLSCGFDAEVVRRMHAVRAGHIRRWSYTRPILSALRSYSFPQLAPCLDGPLASEDERAVSKDKLEAESLATTAAWLFLFNVPRYAAGLDFCPQADPRDGALDLCSFQRSGIMHGLGYLSRLWLGKHQSMRGFRHELCQRLHIPAPLNRQGEIMEVPFQIDGDPGGVLPLDIEVIPSRLSLLTPAKKKL